MFEKIAISITALLVVLFIALYYYQNGTDAPQECIELHNDYTRLSHLIESDEYHAVARKVFPQNKIQHIHNIEKHYNRLLQERFRRSGFDDFKAICIDAKNTMNLPKIIQALEEQKAKEAEDNCEDSHKNYDFLI